MRRPRQRKCSTDSREIANAVPRKSCAEPRRAAIPQYRNLEKGPRAGVCGLTISLPPAHPASGWTDRVGFTPPPLCAKHRTRRATAPFPLRQPYHLWGDDDGVLSPNQQPILLPCNCHLIPKTGSAWPTDAVCPNSFSSHKNLPQELLSSLPPPTAASTNHRQKSNMRSTSNLKTEAKGNGKGKGKGARAGKSGGESASDPLDQGSNHCDEDSEFKVCMAVA